VETFFEPQLLNVCLDAFGDVRWSRARVERHPQALRQMPAFIETVLCPL
jgi:hypothetical protein